MTAQKTSPLPAKAALAAALALICMAGPLWAGEPPGLSRAYRIDASVDPEKGMIAGQVLITMQNRTGRALPRVVLILYPNAFRRPSPKLNDINHDWFYPGAFRPGSLTVSGLTAVGGRARRLETTFEKAGDGPKETALSVALHPPLDPGEELGLRVSFRTVVPCKFGPLGRVDDLLTANGGWYPFLAPYVPGVGWAPRATPPFCPVEAQVKVPKGWQAVLDGRVFPAGATARIREKRINVLPLSLAEAFHAYTADIEGVRFTYYRADRDESFGKKVLDTAKAAIPFFLRSMKRRPPKRLVLVESRARSNLTMHAGASGLVSDRILRVLPYPVDLRKYHLREVAFQIFYLLFLPSVSRVEDVRDFNWTCEACAWLALRRYLAQRQIEYDEVVDLLRVFSFIPAIDRTLVAPRFAFNDVFFDTFFKMEPLREHIFRFANRTPFGRIVVEKLRDALPRDKAKPALLAYLQGGGKDERLQATVERVTGADLAWFWEQWRKEYPSVNYVMGEVRSTPLGKGRVRTSVEILRTGKSGFAEFVNLGVILKDGRRFKGRVLVTGPRTVDTFVYPDEPERIIIDPTNRCREKNKTDNISPRSLKLLVTNFYPRLDISPDFSHLGDSHFNLDVRGGFAAIAEGDYANQVFLNYFYESRGFGFNLGYMRSLGFKVDRTDFPQGVGAFLFFERLDPGFARVKVQPGEDPDKRLIVTSLRLFYRLDTRIDHTDPHSGFALTVTGEFADKVLGTDFRFAALTANMRGFFSPFRHHVLGLQIRAGTSWGEMPRQRLMALGGFSGLRGMTDHDVLGSQQFILRCEYRHLLLNELDLNFFWIGYIRRLSGAFFFEVGAVTDRFSHLFRLDSYRSSIGYGLKISFDSFGVRPFLIGIDIGFRLDEPSPTPEIYLTMGQSF